MKTIKLLLTIMLVACYSFGASVQAGPPVTYDPHSVDIPTFIVQTAIAPQKVKVLVSNLQGRKTKIWLEDKNGKALFKATVRNRNAYGKNLDMSALKPSIYRFVINQGKGQRIVEPIHLKNLCLETQIDH